MDEPIGEVHRALNFAEISVLGDNIQKNKTMLTIRLTRRGKKNQPFFRVVLIDKRCSTKGGRAVEVLGNVDPRTKKRIIKKERILYWISKGAQTSDTVHNLLVSEKIIDAKKIHVSKLSKKKKAEMAAKASASAKAMADKKEEVAVKAKAEPSSASSSAVGTPEPEASATEAKADKKATDGQGESNPAEVKALEAEAPVETLPASVEPDPVETPAEKPAEQPAATPEDSGASLASSGREPEKPAEPASAESSGEAKQPPTA